MGFGVGWKWLLSDVVGSCWWYLWFVREFGISVILDFGFVCLLSIICGLIVSFSEFLIVVWWVVCIIECVIIVIILGNWYEIGLVLLWFV